MSAPLVGVLALQGDVREHVRMLSLAGADAVPVRRASELTGLDGIVVPGGESTTIGKLAVTFGLLEPLREAVAAGLPAYGSCAGMILLADTVLDGTDDQPLIGGLDIVVRRNAFGRQVDSFESTVALAGVAGEPMHAVFIRAPWVESVGDAVEVLGRVESSRAGGRQVIGRIVAVRQGAVLATAFHPELTGDPRVHRLFVEMVRSAAGAGTAAQEVS
ncbi:MAG: pyridoxal 5'-phosphate synthase glutaminase subunit PdxT [Actinomycetota bacterium]|nr:pyridoxal 5'-phosphate synthase glutaminase subunit PdxT [Actinomycetota bacterium]